MFFDVARCYYDDYIESDKSVYIGYGEDEIIFSKYSKMSEKILVNKENLEIYKTNRDELIDEEIDENTQEYKISNAFEKAVDILKYAGKLKVVFQDGDFIVDNRKIKSITVLDEIDWYEKAVLIEFVFEKE